MFFKAAYNKIETKNVLFFNAKEGLYKIIPHFFFPELHEFIAAILQVLDPLPHNIAI